MTAVQQIPVTESVRAVAHRLAPDCSSPTTLADAILDELGSSPSRLRAALAEVLPGFAGDIIRQARNSAMSGSRGVVQEETAETVTPHRTYGAEHGMKCASSKEMQIRVKYLLGQLIHVQDDYVPLGECSVAQLAFARDERRSIAAKINYRADQLDAQIRAITAAGVNKANELPVTTVNAIYFGASS